MKTDRDLIIDAVEEAQRVLAQYLEPGSLRSTAGTIHQLVTVLDRPELVAAMERNSALVVGTSHPIRGNFPGRC